MENIVFVIPVIESEAGILLSNLRCLEQNLSLARIDNYKVVIIYQTASLEDIPGRIENNRIRVLKTQEYSVSKARNLGVRSVDPDTDRFVCFLDCDSSPSVAFLKISRKCMEAREKFWMGAVAWGDRQVAEHPILEEEESSIFRAKRLSTNRILEWFLWVCVIRVDLVKQLRFDEGIGLGQATILKSGEDTLFLYELVVANGVRRVVWFRGAVVFHPKRPNDYSKQLLYAEGQGALYRRLLFEKPMPFVMRVATSVYFVLFVGNALYRVLTLKRNSVEILVRRIKGFAHL